MKAIQYRIFLERPLLATTLLGDPGSSVSFSYIPGSLLRGMIIQHYLQSNQVPDMAGDTTCRRCFFDAQTQYLHAYVLIENQRSLPTPQSLLKYKNNHFDESTKTIGVFDGSHQRWTDTQRQKLEEHDSLKSLAKSVPFCTMTRKYGYEPVRTVAVHVQRDRKRGHGIKGKHPVFQYDALAAEQCFVGVILVENAEDAAALEQQLNQIDIIWLGRSRSANYGKVRISNVELIDEWREIEDDYPELVAGEHCTLTLTSDTLLRDHGGNPVATLDNTILSAYLGIDVELLPAHTFTSVTTLGGFNRTWHLPLAQTYALEAGSVIAFKPVQTLHRSDVQRLEQQGIGERRAEGFGRVVFNWQQEVEFSITKEQGDQDHLYVEEQTLTSPSVAHRLATQIANRLCEQSITHAITRFIRDHIESQPKLIEQMPHNSQLARVRMLVRQAMPTDDVARVLREFQAFRPAARRQFDQAFLQNKSLTEWIETLLEQPDIVWKDRLAEVRVPAIAGQHADLQALSARTALRLLEAVLITPAHMRKKERA